MLTNMRIYRITSFGLFLLIANEVNGCRFCSVTNYLQNIFSVLRKKERHTCLKRQEGVFGVDKDEVKSVSVMEGDSVTLHTNFTHIRRYDHILWVFGPQETRIAELYKQSIDMLDGSKLFGEWTLWLDSQTGSLTITNISTSHTGLYKQIIRNTETYNAPQHMQFNVIVYARPPKDSLTEHYHLLMAISAGVISLVLIAGLILLYRKCKHKSKKVVQREEEEVHYIDRVFIRKNKQMKNSGTGDPIYSSIK